MRRIWVIVGAAVLVAVAGYFLFLRGGGGIPVNAVKLVATLPHDSKAFTEGFFYQDGLFYESTGEVGTSGFRKSKPATGETVQQEELPAPYFGEGIVAWKDRLYEVTWKDHAGFVYNLSDFSQRDTFTYTGEGWGLTHNDTSLILSDGTPTLRFLDPDTLRQTATLAVTANGCPVRSLNELEWVDGEIYANIWQTDLIARIDPASGKVKGFLDVSALGPRPRGEDDVANGIAYDSAGKRLFVTGKMWPQIYQVTAGSDPASDSATSAAQTIMDCKKGS